MYIMEFGFNQRYTLAISRLARSLAPADHSALATRASQPSPAHSWPHASAVAHLATCALAQTAKAHFVPNSNPKWLNSKSLISVSLTLQRGASSQHSISNSPKSNLHHHP